MGASGQRRLEGLVAAVVSELSKGQAEALASEFESLTEPSMVKQVAGWQAPSTVIELSEAWLETGALDGSTLATAIRCAARAAHQVSSYEKIELLYTGPGSGTIRRNEYGLLDVIRSAKHDLWVVSFVLVGVEEVIQAVTERRTAGVEVRVLLDHHVDRFEKTLALLTEHELGDAVWIWNDEHRDLDHGRMRALHAKCAVADGHMAFISSANFTDKAMDENLEVGVLVTGGAVPQTLRSNFDELLADGLLERRLT